MPPAFPPSLPKVVANLPYNITKDFLITMLPKGDSVSELNVMIQEEAAQRLVDQRVGRPDYRSMNLRVNFYSRPKYRWARGCERVRASGRESGCGCGCEREVTPTLVSESSLESEREHSRLLSHSHSQLSLFASCTLPCMPSAASHTPPLSMQVPDPQRAILPGPRGGWSPGHLPAHPTQQTGQGEQGPMTRVASPGVGVVAPLVSSRSLARPPLALTRAHFFSFLSSPPPQVPSEKGFLALVGKAFLSRRKMMRNSIEPLYTTAQVEEALGKCGLRKDARAQDLSLDDFVRVHHALSEQVVAGLLGPEGEEEEAVKEEEL